jgi:hypothetical protein
MRHTRFRLRSSIIFILTVFSFLCMLTFHTLIWSINELEPFPSPSNAFEQRKTWPIFHQVHIQPFDSNISYSSVNESSNVTSTRIEQLYRSIRHAHLMSSNRSRMLLSNDSRWPSMMTIADNVKSNIDQLTMTNHSFSKNNQQTNHAVHSKKIHDDEQRKLRVHIHEQLMKWKKEHQHDATVSLAEIMHDSLAQDEPEYVMTIHCQHVCSSLLFVFLLFLYRHVHRSNSS